MKGVGPENDIWEGRRSSRLCEVMVKIASLKLGYVVDMYHSVEAILVHFIHGRMLTIF